jgi:ferredoxin
MTLLLWLVVLAMPVVVGAHGADHGGTEAVAAGDHAEHGGAKAPGATAALTVDGYRVELSSHPSPLIKGQPGHLVATVLHGESRHPVSGSRVLIGMAPAGGDPEPLVSSEETGAGSYSISITPSGLGAHQGRVVLEGIQGRRMETPLVLDFPIGVEKPAGLGLGMAVWLLLAAVTGGGLLATYAVVHRARLGRSAEPRLDLLTVPWIRRLLTARAFQPALQIPTLGVMAIVVWLGLFDVQDGGMNLSTKLTWTIWWAGVIFTFVLVGRAWCVACPFGALNEWTSRLTGATRRLPRPFRNIWWATGMFVLLTWADEQLGVVRSPRVTAWIVILFAALAIAIGLVFERRSFCRYLCPIGGVIGIYSMTAPLELRPRLAAVCAADRLKGCYRGTAAVSGCPMLEFPGALDRNNYCTMCAKCVTACEHGNLALRVRAWGRDLWATTHRALDEAYLAVVLVGLTVVVTAQMLGAWPGWVSTLAGYLPAAVRSSLAPATYRGLVESILLLGGALVAGPLLVLGGAALADRLAGARLGLRRTFIMLGYVLVPIALAMHLAHNLAHLLLEGGGIVPVIQRVVALYTPFSLGAADWRATPLAPEPVVALLQVAVVVAFFGLSLVAGHRLTLRAYPDARAASRAFLPMAGIALAFTLVGLIVLSLPMGMRHGS